MNIYEVTIHYGNEKLTLSTLNKNSFNAIKWSIENFNYYFSKKEENLPEIDCITCKLIM